MNSNVQTLFDGPLDIIGDVHGEFDTLRSLMQKLGYDSLGKHPDDRRLIFVGDLTDRGPDSIAVCKLVSRLIESGRAQCVLGNHDLNLLLGLRKHDNGWFYGETFSADKQIVPQTLADDLARQEVLELFQKLPIALERPDLRVIHACWDEEMIKVTRQASDVVQLYHEQRKVIEAELSLTQIDQTERQLRHQNNNPVKLLTSGPETRVDKPSKSSGKLRHSQRVKWWQDYRGVFVVFGHYSILDGNPRGSDSAFCIDYGVGKRWTERRTGTTHKFKLKLAALRWPEREVVLDEGSFVSDS